MFKAALSVIVLSLAPVSALAAGCSGHQEAAMSCAEGTVWNPDTTACERASS